MSTKVQEIGNLKSGDSVVKYAVADDFMVRVYGDVAVVTFRHTSKGEEKGKDTSGQFRITDTWVKHAGLWRCVAGHSSRIAQK
jgi:ketosteroid isomerase-like protein